MSKNTSPTQLTIFWVAVIVAIGGFAYFFEKAPGLLAPEPSGTATATNSSGTGTGSVQAEALSVDERPTNFSAQVKGVAPETEAVLNSLGLSAKSGIRLKVTEGQKLPVTVQ